MPVLVLYLLYLLLPIALLLIGSFGQSWSNTLLPQGITLRWYAELLADPSFRRAFQVSLTIAGAVCVANALLGVPLAYAIHHAASRGVRAAARIAYLLPVAAPPLVLAFGFMLVFSSDTLPFLGDWWVLAGGHLVLTLPYMLATLSADMRHLGLGQLERAAGSLGAGFSAILLRVVLPSLRHSLAAGLVMVAAISIGEFQLSNLIAGVLTRPYPVLLLQAFYNATGFACAATVLLLLLAVLAAAGGALTGRGAAASRVAA
jgi:putative spermidine/putrescine transport system permease protein